MSTPFEALCGPSYGFNNKFASVERCVNWYVTPNEESGTETKFKTALMPSPGNMAFGQLPVPAPYNQPNRGLLELRGQFYGVNGTVVFEMSSKGVYLNVVGTVASDGKPVSMVANGNGQIFIASAGLGYVIPKGGGVGTLIAVNAPGDFLGASYATFQDGYILVVTPNSNQIQISGNDTTPLGDATLWSAANISIQAGQQDYLKAIISSREYVRLMGHRRSQVYANVGNNGVGNFPFQSFNETFIETGLAATFSLADLGDSLIWIGEDSRGIRACWRDGAFQPARVSNFAVEQQWQNYARIDDAVAFPFIWRGHLMYQVSFPSAFVNNPVSGFPLGASPTYSGATWVYDVTASALLGKSIWHERSYQTAMGYAQCRSEQFHAFAFGLHLVGSVGLDGNPGAIYQYSDGPGGYTDCGRDINGNQITGPIVRQRIVPHIWSSNKRIIVNRLELELSRGTGLDGNPPVGVDPQIYLQISRDGGNSYGPELNAPIGRIGEYLPRVLFNRLGYGRDTVYKLTFSDPCYMGLVNAELDLFEAGS